MIERLIVANLKLFEVCERKRRAVESGESDPAALRAIIEQDLALCRSRAAIRADLNRRLGSTAQGESVKTY